MTKLTIKTLPTVVAGKFVDQYVVVDGAGNLIGKKAHRSEAEASVELGGLKYYATGLEFARATAAEGATEKSLVGKANVVAAFLLFQEQKEAGEVAEVPVVDEALVAEAANEEEFADEEQF